MGEIHKCPGLKQDFDRGHKNMEINQHIMFILTVNKRAIKGTPSGNYVPYVHMRHGLNH